MNRSKLLVTLLLALALAGSASILVFQRINQGNQPAAMATVVVAARNLDIGTALGPQDVREVQWPTGNVPKGAVMRATELKGRAVIYPVAENEPLLEMKLAANGSGAGLPAVIPQGMRAVSIRVDEVVAVAGFVGPGTRVDVLLTGTPGTKNEALTRTILQNVQVLAAGQKIQPDAEGRAEKVNVVTLLCSGEDAAKVTLAANEGRIQLVLRNPTDTAVPERVAMVGRAALYGEAKPAPVAAPRPKAAPVAAPAPAPAPAPPVVVEKVEPPSTVIVIRADRVTSVTVPHRKAESVNQ
ncbi:MAG: Flp pilus assembly protein CpaB [Acidobacteria bacterium]|nr:Flp pilus assembly protein CpaB [Acidobacteriota bacterium]